MAVLVIVAAFVLVAVEPPLVLCVITLLYAISGPDLNVVIIAQTSRVEKDKRRGCRKHLNLQLIALYSIDAS